MNKKIVLFCCLLPFKIAFAACDLSEFKWECDLLERPVQTATARSLVYCGNAYGYLTTQQYDILRRYQRANVNMVLKINGEYITGPCVVSHRR